MTEPKNSPNTAHFAVQNIYTKDVSFESPNTPKIFGMKWEPKLDFDLQTIFNNIEENLFEVILHITVTVKNSHKENDNPEETPAFLVDIKQAGIFLAQNFAEDQLKHLLSTTAPSILYPYARELASSLVGRGGFPQLLLPPMNFEALYQHHLKEQQDRNAKK